MEKIIARQYKEILISDFNNLTGRNLFLSSLPLASFGCFMDFRLPKTARKMATMAEFLNHSPSSDIEMFLQFDLVMFQVTYGKNINVKRNIKNFSQKSDLVIAGMRSYPRAVL